MGVIDFDLQGHFYPSAKFAEGVLSLALSVCLSVCPSVRLYILYVYLDVRL